MRVVGEGIDKKKKLKKRKKKRKKGRKSEEKSVSNTR